jgi:hypothetical protein
MNKFTLAFTGALLLTGLASSADAHHSAAQFDFRNTVELSGTVKEARFSNPHARLVLEVSDERGTRDIEFEGHSRNNMIRQGLTPDMMEVGDTIRIRIAPMRDGSDGGYVTALITEDGEAVGRITQAD